MEENENTKKYPESDYRGRTDNKYLPNTEEGWTEFFWQCHFLNAKAMVLFWHLDRLEKQARKNEKDSQSN